MAIPVKHTIKLEEVHQMNYDRDIYRNTGTPPRFHVVCSCQWEGWTHDRPKAIQFINSHIGAQVVRGNTVEVVGVDMTPVAEAVAPQPSGAEPGLVAQQPSEADAQSEVQVLDVDVSEGYPDEIKGEVSGVQVE